WSAPVVHAEHNYFGNGVDPHDPQEVSGNFDINPYCTSPILFDTLDIIAVPSPLEFDTVSVNTSKTSAVALFNVKNSLTDSIEIFATHLNDNRSTLELASPFIRAMEPETLVVTIRPKVSGEYSDTLTLLTNVGPLTISIHAVIVEPVSVSDQPARSQPLTFGLSQNFPNPFNPSSKIQYSVSSLPEGQPRTQYVSMKIYDVLGREVATLVDEMKEPGEHYVDWDASGITSGIYFYRLQAGGFVETKKMAVVR
ncbi:MAG TPA: T9SS type A sorting domain-containing protein, partial [Bacteroidota bacterium]|nr:T9SS type A sorting domain-containing protein [Bacteroidota bacterium]